MLISMHPAVGGEKIPVKDNRSSLRLAVHLECVVCAAEAVGDAVGAGVRRETDGDS